MQWEYCILEVEPKYDTKTKKVYGTSTLVYTGNERVTLLAGENLPIAQVSHLGQQGWELVSVTTLPLVFPGNIESRHISYYMKRPIK